MKKKMIVCVLGCALLLAGCGSRSEHTVAGVAEPGFDEARSDRMTVGAERTAAIEGGLPETRPRQMVIYNAEMSLVVRDSGAARDDITQMVQELGGYVSNSRSSALSGGLQRITLTLRVPSEAFNDAMGRLRDLAMQISQETIGSQDVTQEYVDLGSRLRALEAKADRLEELMARAENTQAVLAVYEQLSRTQVEIERAKGRMQYLERSAAMATITVSLMPDALSQPLEIAGWRLGGTAKTAFESLVRFLQWLIAFGIWMVILVLPVLLLLGGACFLFIKGLLVLFRRSRRTPSTAPAPPA